MNFLIDSADLDEIRQAMELPFVNGVTTNTREMAYQASDDIHAYLKQMRTIARGIIHVQVTTEDEESMIAEGRALTRAVPDLRVKIPVTTAGLRAMVCLSSEGVEVAATAVNTVTMAVLAAKAGARVVIPYYGVLEDFEEDATGLLADIVKAFERYVLRCELIFFARNPKQAREGIRAGADGCLMTLAGLRSLLDHPLSSREVALMNRVWHERFGDKTWAE